MDYEAAKVIRLFGIEEAELEKILLNAIKVELDCQIVTHVKNGEITLQINARGKGKKEAENKAQGIENEIRNRLQLFIYGEGDEELEEVVAELLIKNRLTVSTAESCTGGLLAGRLINYPGISSVFMEGVITYSNEAKLKRLNVQEATLTKYGAVSTQTAEEMAAGIAAKAGTDIGISVTGIAGPGGGTEEKPVGLVYIGLYINGTAKSRKLNLKGSRQEIRHRTTSEALNWLRIELASLEK